MLSLKESSTDKSLWIAAVGCFVLTLSVGLVLAAPLDKITICHKGKTITVSQNAIPAHAAHGDTGGACNQEGCACPLIFDPVTCASNGRTYINLCVAECDGATGCVRDTGPVCACPAIWNPVVCGGITYANLCIAACEGASSGCRGPGICACPAIFLPVTCSDGVTYVNLCTAECLGATGCGGCACPVTIDPVHCTSNNTNYFNLCQAECAGASGCSRIYACPAIWDPYICSNGNIFANQCVADNDSGGLVCVPLGQSCACQPSIDPVVCSSNGQTYINQCVATCNAASGCAPAP